MKFHTSAAEISLPPPPWREFKPETKRQRRRAAENRDFNVGVHSNTREYRAREAGRGDALVSDCVGVVILYVSPPKR